MAEKNATTTTKVISELVSDDRTILQYTPNLLQELRRRQLSPEGFFKSLKDGLSKGLSPDDWYKELLLTGQNAAARRLQRLLPSGMPIIVEPSLSGQRKKTEAQKKLDAIRERIQRQRDLLDPSFVEELQGFVEDARLLLNEEWFALATENLTEIQRLLDEELSQALDERLERFHKAQEIIKAVLEKYIHAESVLRLDNTISMLWELVSFANQSSVDIEGELNQIIEICHSIDQLYQSAPVNQELLTRLRSKYGTGAENNIENINIPPYQSGDKDVSLVTSIYPFQPREENILAEATLGQASLVLEDLIRMRTPTNLPWNEETANRLLLQARVFVSLKDSSKTLENGRYIIRYWSERKSVPDPKLILHNIREVLSSYAKVQATTLQNKGSWDSACEYFRIALKLQALDERLVSTERLFLYTYFMISVNDGEKFSSQESVKSLVEDNQNEVSMFKDTIEEVLSFDKGKRSTLLMTGMIRLAHDTSWLLIVLMQALRAFDKKLLNFRRLETSIAQLEAIYSLKPTSPDLGDRFNYLVKAFTNSRGKFENMLDQLWDASQNSRTLPGLNSLLDNIILPDLLLNSTEVKLLEGLQRLNREVQRYYFSEPDFQESNEIILNLLNTEIPSQLEYLGVNPTNLGTNQIRRILNNIRSLLEEEQLSLYQVSLPSLDAKVEQGEWRSDSNYYCHLKVRNLGETRAEKVKLIVEESDIGDYSIIDPEKDVGTILPGKSKMFHLLVDPDPVDPNRNEFALQVRLVYNIPHQEKMEERFLRLRVEGYSKNKKEYVLFKNPYVASGPLSDDRMFYGRKELMQELSDEVANPDRTGSVVIYGQRRSGKTSVLNQLAKNIPNNIVSLYFDCSSLITSLPRIDSNLSPIEKNEARKQALGQFLHGLSMDIIRIFAERGVTLIPLTFDKIMESPGPDFQFRRFLEQLKPLSSNLRLLVMLDEFTGLMQKIDEDTIDESIMRLFKSLIEGGYFSCVICGVTEVYTAVQRFANQLAVSKPILVDYLSRRAAHDLIVEPILLPDGTSRYYPENLAEEIIDLTAGNPFYIQYFCNNLVSYMQKMKIDRVTGADIDFITSSLLSGDQAINPDQHFDNLYQYKDNTSINRNDILEGLIIHTLAHETSSKIYATVQNLHNHFRDFVSEDELNQTLNQLEQRGTIILQTVNTSTSPQGQIAPSRAYRIKVDLFRRWILANRPLDKNALASFRARLNN